MTVFSCLFFWKKKQNGRSTDWAYSLKFAWRICKALKRERQRKVRDKTELKDIFSDKLAPLFVRPKKVQNWASQLSIMQIRQSMRLRNSEKCSGCASHQINTIISIKSLNSRVPFCDTVIYHVVLDMNMFSISDCELPNSNNTINS